MAAALALLLLALLPGGSTADRRRASTEPSEQPPPPPPRVGPIRIATLGRGGTLGAALDRLSVRATLRPALLAEIESRIDARRLSPRTGLAAQIDDEGDWRRLAVRVEPRRLLLVEIDPTADGAKTSSAWVDLAVEREVRTTAAVIRSSVAEALADRPYGRELAPAFADVFQWDVDLLVDPRAGDRIRIVYEIERLGRTPALLPPYDGAPSRSGEPLGLGRILAASYAGQMARASAFWVDDGGAGNYYDPDGRPLRKTFLKSPLNYRRISSRFSNARRNPVTREVVPHHGVDYAARAGTPVVAAADGRVASVGWDGPLGRAVRIRHGSEYVTVYGHLQGFARGIRPGVEVRQNQVIGYVGATGRATGPHLHYAMIHRGRSVDPLKILNPSIGPLNPTLLPQLELAVRRWRPMIDVEIRPDRGAAAYPASSRNSVSQAARNERSTGSPECAARTRPARSISQV